MYSTQISITARFICCMSCPFPSGVDVFSCYSLGTWKVGLIFEVSQDLLGEKNERRNQASTSEAWCVSSQPGLIIEEEEKYEASKLREVMHQLSFEDWVGMSWKGRLLNILGNFAKLWCLFAYIYRLVCLFVCLFDCLFVCLFACLLVCLFACLLVCLFACLLVCLFACLFVCLFPLCQGWPNPAQKESTIHAAAHLVLQRSCSLKRS